MNSFEKYLIENGYIMFAFDASKMQYYKPQRHTISTMVNLGHIYIHESDRVLLDKIEQGKKVIGEDCITAFDRKNEIIFGLSEKDKPPTLIRPRPRIKVSRTIEGKTYFQDEQYDDSMNIVLSKFSHEEIYKAMFDKSIVLECVVN
jgi:hypothetical protein